MMIRHAKIGALVIAFVAMFAFSERTCLAASPARSQLVFKEPSPHSKLEEILSRTDVEFFDEATRTHIRPEALQRQFDQQKAAWTYDLTKEPFDVVVPPSAGSVPHGLFVWLGGCDVPDGWLDALARQKLIFVAAHSGGDRVSIVREALALDAVHNLSKRYRIDPDRVYVAGFGNGAQIAAWMARAWPEVFSGAYLLMGGWFYTIHLGYTDWYFANGESDGHWYAHADTMPPAWKTSPAWPLEKIKKQKKLVFVRGEQDKSCAPREQPADDRLQYEGLRLDGFERVSYVEMADLGHTAPPGDAFERGLLALEAAPHEPPTTAPTADVNPQPSQSAQARRMLISTMHGGSIARMRELLEAIVRDYPNTDSAALARKGLEKLHRSK